MKVVAVEHQQLQPFQPCQGPVVDGVDAVEPTGTQNMHVRTLLVISAKPLASTHTLTPSLYAVCVGAGQEVR